jgi:hypothetical protein
MSKSADSSIVPVAKDDPEELSLDYFDKNPQTYSAQVLQNLATNPLFRFLFESKNKKPTAKDMLLVSSVVVSAADQKITTLEQERIKLQKEASKIRAVLGNPIWSVRALPAPIETPPVADENADVAKSSEAEKKAEQQWLARYLTLGNVLGAIVIILGMLGGTLTYFTANFKDRAGRAEASATFWENQSASYQKQLERDQETKKKADEATQNQIADLNDRLKQSQTLSSGLTEQLRQANKKIEDLQKTGEPPK